MESLREYWDNRVGLGPVRAVADPNDKKGYKYKYVSSLESGAILSALSGIPAASTVLDFGCGTGNLSKIISDENLRITGVDISLNMLKYAHRHSFRNPALFVQYDGDGLPFNSNCFDACVTCGVLVYLTEKDHFLRVLNEIRRVLKPGAKLLALEQTGLRTVSEPSRRKLQRSAKEFQEILSEAGFIIREKKIIRRGHFPLIYPIRYGLLPSVAFPLLGRLESLWGRVFGQPFFDYAITLFIVEKPS